MSDDLTDALQERVAAAFAKATPLAIRGGNTKAFLGHPADGAFLDTGGHSGIVAYQPGELVVTARAGTRLAEVESALAERGQMLAFEPPHFGDNATLGGTVAAGLSGPRRPYAGAARDFVLGSRIVNGRGELLRFGGEVMKNVAGYDISRLMAGSFGTLGLLLDISLKVLPAPARETTLVRQATQAQAIDTMNELAGKALPLSGAYWEAGRLYLRVSGTPLAVAGAAATIGGELLDDNAFWTRGREQQTPFFCESQRLWRLSLPPATPPLQVAGFDPEDCAIDWGGAQRWLRGDPERDAATEAEALRAAAAAAGGHATLFRGSGAPAFHPLPRAMQALQERVKQALDPAGILNPGRLVAPGRDA